MALLAFYVTWLEQLLPILLQLQNVMALQGGLFSFLDSGPGFMWHLGYNFPFFFCNGCLFQTDSEWERIDVKNRAIDIQLGNLKGWEWDRVLGERLTQWVWVFGFLLVLLNLLAGDITRMNLCTAAVPQWMNSCAFKVWSCCQRSWTAQW